MASWHYVSSRKLQTGQQYGVWSTTTGVTSTDQLVQWLAAKGWHVMTVWARDTLPTGQLVKEMHAVWMGRDGTELPASDARTKYGALYISDSSTEDPGAVPQLAPGERPPPSAEVLAAMNPPKPGPGRWKLPAMVAAAALTFVTILRGGPRSPSPPAS